MWTMGPQIRQPRWTCPSHWIWVGGAGSTMQVHTARHLCPVCSVQCVTVPGLLLPKTRNRGMASAADAAVCRGSRESACSTLSLCDWRKQRQPASYALGWAERLNVRAAGLLTDDAESLVRLTPAAAPAPSVGSAAGPLPPQVPQSLPRRSPRIAEKASQPIEQGAASELAGTAASSIATAAAGAAAPAAAATAAAAAAATGQPAAGLSLGEAAAAAATSGSAAEGSAATRSRVQGMRFEHLRTLKRRAKNKAGTVLMSAVTVDEHGRSAGERTHLPFLKQRCSNNQLFSCPC